MFLSRTVTYYEPHYEKTGFSHMRKKDADQLRGNLKG